MYLTNSYKCCYCSIWFAMLRLQFTQCKLHCLTFIVCYIRRDEAMEEFFSVSGSPVRRHCERLQLYAHGARSRTRSRASRIRTLWSFANSQQGIMSKTFKLVNILLVINGLNLCFFIYSDFRGVKVKSRYFITPTLTHFQLVMKMIIIKTNTWRSLLLPSIQVAVWFSKASPYLVCAI